MKQPPDPPIVPDGLLDPDEDDDLDDDEDDDDLDHDDDEDIRELVVERCTALSDESQPWQKITSTTESVTVALDARVGCLVRVISWDLDGRFHMTTTWCHGVRIKDLQGGTP